MTYEEAYVISEMILRILIAAGLGALVGIEQQIRAAFEEIGSYTESFRADHHLRQQRVKMDAVVRLKPNVLAEKLSDRLAAIKGVRIDQYE